MTDLFNDDSNEFVIRAERMSNTIIDIMMRLSENEGLAMLILNDVYEPFSIPITDKKRKKFIKVGNSDARISPRPFSPETQTEDSSFIRVYYNVGEFDERE